MEKLRCDVCGGDIEIQAGGQQGKCVYCGTKYSLNRLREMFSGVKVSVTGSEEDVAQWKSLLNTYLKACDFEAAEKTVKKILEAEPSDEYANEMYGQLQDWKYMEVKNGVLLKYRGINENVIIPDGVKKIGEYAFSEKITTVPSNLKSVIIPNSVTSIDENAFCNCENLTDINIPDSVTSIERGAFSGCSSLKSINIPNSVTSIGNSAFSGCSSLKSVYIPNSVENIEKYAFFACQRLDNITMPDKFNQEEYIKSIFFDTDFMRNYFKARGKCQYCGGTFKNGGILVLKVTCTQCNREKDY